MRMQLYPASEKNGPVTHYCVIVVPSEIAEREIIPNSFSLDEVISLRIAFVGSVLKYKAVIVFILAY